MTKTHTTSLDRTAGASARPTHRTRPSRLDFARQRVAGARHVLAVLSLGSFGAMVVLLRGTAATTSPAPTAVQQQSVATTQTPSLSAPAALTSQIHGEVLGGGSIASSPSPSQTSISSAPVVAATPTRTS